MAKNILGIAGKKQSGKSTCGKFIIGHLLVTNKIVEQFAIDENDGALLIPALNEYGELGQGELVLDPLMDTENKCSPIMDTVSEHCMVFNFAFNLKMIAHKIFNLTPEQMYGTEEQKNDWTEIYDNEAFYHDKRKVDYTKCLTSREFLQKFGTLIREIEPLAWVNSCLRDINSVDTNLAIVCDVRYPNEVEAIKKAGGKVIKLTRSLYEDAHSSETELDDPYDQSVFDAVIDNHNKDLVYKNQELYRILREWDWIPK